MIFARAYTLGEIAASIGDFSAPLRDKARRKLMRAYFFSAWPSPLALTQARASKAV
jgi:hypothetical protein